VTRFVTLACRVPQRSGRIGLSSPTRRTAPLIAGMGRRPPLTLPRQTSPRWNKHSRRSGPARRPFRLCRFSQLDRPSTTRLRHNHYKRNGLEPPPHNRNGLRRFNRSIATAQTRARGRGSGRGNRPRAGACSPGRAHPARYLTRYADYTYPQHADGPVVGLMPSRRIGTESARLPAGQVSTGLPIGRLMPVMQTTLEVSPLSAEARFLTARV
jgi:hypothetical protein